MSKSRITFLVVGDQKGITRKFAISVIWLKMALAICLVGFLSFSAIVVDYFSLVVETSENNRLRLKNIQMTEQLSSLQGKMGLLEDEMEHFRAFTTKLKIMINPLPNEDTDLSSLHRGIGLVEDEALSVFQNKRSDSLQDMSSRNITSLRNISLLNEDATFFQSPPLNLRKGELVVEKNKEYALLNIRLDKAINDSRLQRQDGIRIWESLSQRQSLLKATPAISPAKGWVTSNFGYRISPYTNTTVFHQGLDIAASPGTPVRATGSGVVTYTGYDAGYGKLVSIDHGYGILTRYGHNAEIFVVMGQKVKRGDVIATVGNTGRSTGPHLHYEVRLNSIPINPKNYILSN